MNWLIDAEQTSLRGDGKTDNTGRLGELLGNLSADGGGELILPRGTYVIHGTVEVPPDVTLRINRPATLQCMTDCDVLRVHSGAWVTGGGQIRNMAFAEGSTNAHLLYRGEGRFGADPRDRINGAEQISLVGPYHGGVGVKLLCDGPGQIIHQLRFNNINFLRGLTAVSVECNAPGATGDALSWIHSIAVTNSSIQWYHTALRCDQSPRKGEDGTLANSVADITMDNVMIQCMADHHPSWPLVDIWGRECQLNLYVWDGPKGDWPLWKLHPAGYDHVIETNFGPHRHTGNYSCRVDLHGSHRAAVRSYGQMAKINPVPHGGAHFACPDGPDGPCLLISDGETWRRIDCPQCERKNDG